MDAADAILDAADAILDAADAILDTPFNIWDAADAICDTAERNSTPLFRFSQTTEKPNIAITSNYFNVLANFHAIFRKHIPKLTIHPSNSPISTPISSTSQTKIS